MITKIPQECAHELLKQESLRVKDMVRCYSIRDGSKYAALLCNGQRLVRYSHFGAAVEYYLEVPDGDSERTVQTHSTRSKTATP